MLFYIVFVFVFKTDLKFELGFGFELSCTIFFQIYFEI